MKKIACFFFTFCVMTVNAQVKVNNNGSVTMGNTTTASTKVSVGPTSTSLNYSYAGMYAAVSPEDSGWHLGVVGDAWSLSGHSSSAKKIGIYGGAGSNPDGYNYGVVGTVTNYYGAGIYGGVGTAYPSSISGIYAGYFKGNVYIDGTIFHYGSYTTSDATLKENISPLSEEEKGSASTLDKVLDINVVKYNYKDGVGENQPSKAKSSESAEKTLHFGVLAQELKEIYPNLVKEAEDGLLAVNYVELVPVLIQSIKELNQKVEELSANSEVAMAKGLTGVNTTTASANKLFQNTPNPFKESTVIRFTLADDAADAAICIFDMTGKQLKRIPVAVGMDSVTINGGDLGAGMFLYSLIVDGQEIDTKRMILSK